MANERAGKTQKQRDDEKLDEALKESFPASDPPAMTDPVSHVESDKDPAGQRKK